MVNTGIGVPNTLLRCPSRDVWVQFPHLPPRINEMARTYRKLPPEWEGEECEFTKKWKRGQSSQGSEISADEGRYDEAWGPRGKRDAKKKRRRDRRLKSKKQIDEHLDDFNL